jgi:hypothetical protein
MSNTTDGTLGPTPPDQARATGPDLGPEALVYIEKVRQATARLSAREVAPQDIRQALQALRDVATFDVEVPTTSPRREVQLVKTGVKRLSAWYMRYLSAQLNAFGASIVSLGDALASRTERLEANTDQMAARLGAVEERLRRLETGSSPKPGPAASSVAAHPSAGPAQAGSSPASSPSGTAATSPRSRRNAPRRGQRP